MFSPCSNWVEMHWEHYERAELESRIQSIVSTDSVLGLTGVSIYPTCENQKCNFRPSASYNVMCITIVLLADQESFVGYQKCGYYSKM